MLKTVTQLEKFIWWDEISVWLTMVRKTSLRERREIGNVDPVRAVFVGGIREFNPVQNG